MVNCRCGHPPAWHFPFAPAFATVKTWDHTEESEQTHRRGRAIGCLLCLQKAKDEPKFCWEE